MRISKSAMTVCGVVIAAALIGFTNPKAVHAVTAALVQVTNTATNPVVTQSIGAQATNLVHLGCNAQMDEFVTLSTCTLIPANANEQFVYGYTVPQGESLVITAVSLMPEAAPLCASDYYVQLVNLPPTVSTPAVVYLEATTPNSLLSTHIAYPSGVVVGGGVTLKVRGSSRILGGYQTCSDYEVVDLYGYLTAA